MLIALVDDDGQVLDRLAISDDAFEELAALVLLQILVFRAELIALGCSPLRFLENS